jgi:hypothetical protein
VCTCAVRGAPSSSTAAQTCRTLTIPPPPTFPPSRFPPPPPTFPPSLRRLEGLDLQSLQFSTLLVDPPRAGLDAQTVQLLREFQSVVYVSCNPGRQRCW